MKEICKDSYEILVVCLCVGGIGNDKISWVRRSYVCKPKWRGDFGVYNLHIVNLVLLGKK